MSENIVTINTRECIIQILVLNTDTGIHNKLSEAGCCTYKSEMSQMMGHSFHLQVKDNHVKVIPQSGSNFFEPQ